VADRIVAVLGRGVVPADTPLLYADDLGALRGDGIFESVHVRSGQPWLIDAHLSRMARSAARLGLPLPDRAALDELAGQALAAWDRAGEAVLRLVCTRGRETTKEPTVFAMVTAVGPGPLRARREGIAVLTATLGYPVGARASAPWLLGGAKTLSYAVNMASLRWAEEHEADDILWVSADGYALEAPTATLVWLDGGTLWTVPPEETGILAGTTARHLLDRAGELGLGAGERLVRPADLVAAQGVWLVSSIRGPAEVRGLDGVPRKPAAETAAIRDLLGFGI
jgi:4-amino-4-deoxychorismate lyase